MRSPWASTAACAVAMLVACSSPTVSDVEGVKPDDSGVRDAMPVADARPAPDASESADAEVAQDAVDAGLLVREARSAGAVGASESTRFRAVGALRPATATATSARYRVRGRLGPLAP